jgi:hypothetical protein
MRLEVREAVVLKDRPKRITQYQGGMAFGKGGTGHASGLVRHWGKRLRA